MCVKDQYDLHSPGLSPGYGHTAEYSPGFYSPGYQESSFGPRYDDGYATLDHRDYGEDFAYVPDKLAAKARMESLSDTQRAVAPGYRKDRAPGVARPESLSDPRASWGRDPHAVNGHRGSANGPRGSANDPSYIGSLPDAEEEVE